MTTTHTQPETTPLHERLADRAYEFWNAEGKGKGMDYDKLKDRLPYRYRVALVVNKYIGQVNNGGFVQWCDNGYALESNDGVYLLGVLDAMPQTPAVERMAFILNQVLPSLQVYAKAQGKRNMWGDIEDGAARDAYDDFESEIEHLQSEFWGSTREEIVQNYPNLSATRLAEVYPGPGKLVDDFLADLDKYLAEQSQMWVEFYEQGAPI